MKTYDTIERKIIIEIYIYILNIVKLKEILEREFESRGKNDVYKNFEDENI